MDQIIVVVGMLTNFVLSYLVKKNAGTAISVRKVVPVLNIAIGILTQMVASANAVVPPTAPTVAMAGFFGTFGRGFLDIVLNGIIQGLLTTGVHSTQKNLRQ